MPVTEVMGADSHVTMHMLQNLLSWIQYGKALYPAVVPVVSVVHQPYCDRALKFSPRQLQLLQHQIIPQ